MCVASVINLGTHIARTSLFYSPVRIRLTILLRLLTVGIEPRLFFVPLVEEDEIFAPEYEIY